MTDAMNGDRGLEGLEAEVPGYIAAALVDLDSGTTLNSHSSRDDFDFARANASNCHIVKQKTAALAQLNPGSAIEEILLTLPDQIHMIRLVSPSIFVYLAADRTLTNVAIVRAAASRLVNHWVGSGA
jgi:hypothetical protein